MNKIVQVTTHPFGKFNRLPRELLTETEWTIRYNPYNRRLRPEEVKDLVLDANGIIAGTEPYTKDIIENCKNLEVISRVGVGFENVDLGVCKDNGVKVTYTPDAPVESVAELAVSQILNLLRGIHISDRSIRKNKWIRHIGFLISEVKIGILGVGRIGSRVAQLLRPFSPQLYGCDLDPNIKLGKQCDIQWMSIHELFKTCELITIHVPLNEQNYYLVGDKELKLMQDGSYLINTSRGKVVNEKMILKYLKNDKLAGVALDVFEKEPYRGELTSFTGVVLTAHIGASARQSRFLMELGATEDCIKVLSGKKPFNLII